MIVNIKSTEIKQGAKGDYLYVSYIDHKDNSEHNKAVFSTLRQKWDLITPNSVLEFKQDARYNIIDILPVEAPEEGHLVKAAKAMGAKVITEKPVIHDTKARSMAIAYAKDLAAAGKIELKDMSAYADKFLEYINK